jgi:hypothetical protein
LRFGSAFSGNIERGKLSERDAPLRARLSRCANVDRLQNAGRDPGQNNFFLDAVELGDLGDGKDPRKNNLVKLILRFLASCGRWAACMMQLLSK